MQDPIFLFFFLAIFIWLGIVTAFLYKMAAHYTRLVDNSGKNDLMSILDNLLEAVRINKNESVSLKNRLFKIETENIKHIQKVGIQKFNPFEDGGGEQSFVLVLLDGADNGIVITSLNNRGNTRWYTKNVIRGKGADIELSNEEKKAIKTASVIQI